MPLVVCATPIGNLEDITLRVLAELRAADVILCEDTRHTRGLLERHGIEARLLSYHEHNEASRTSELLPRLEAGDLVAFTVAGAYGAVMSSTYNSRPLVPEVLVHGGRFAVIRERPSYEAMLALDTIPDWLGGPAEAPRRRGAA